MKIGKIKIENILSYENETINLNEDINIFVGPNGSGKSNFINIIIYILKRFCIKNYEIIVSHGIEMIDYKKYHIHEKNPIYGNDEEHFLAKHKNLLDCPRKINFNIKFERQDIKNLQEIYMHKEKIYDFLDNKIESLQFGDDRYAVQSESVKRFFDIKEENLNEGNYIEISVSEENNKLKIDNSQENDYMIYMKYFSLIYEILNMIGIEHSVKNTFTFFEAYRNNANETTKVGIAKYENHHYSNLQSIQNIKSLAYSLGRKSTYIMLATKKFGTLLRYAIEEKNGIEKFQANSEYVKLKDFFKKFKYDINIECIDKEDNIYQFYLERNGIKIEIDLISSGEREIINFIFGLFLDEIKDGIVIIDEPELHLHPNWQKKLIEILKSETKENNIQIIFVTHSASFINYNLLNNIFRIYLDRKGCSKCTKINDIIDESAGEDIRKKLGIINATNNEKIFFSKYVILVEGITDEILFKRIFEEEIDKNISDVEFINIHGKNNFSNFKEILDKLKINWFYIGDNDNIKEFEEMEKYFQYDIRKAMKDCKKKNRSYYCNQLLEELERMNEGEMQNNEKVMHCYQEFKENVLNLKPDLSEQDKNEIKEFIESKYNDSIYILKNGEIEDYLGVGKNNKPLGFEKTIKINTDKYEYDLFKETENFKELNFIIQDIAKKIKNNEEL